MLQQCCGVAADGERLCLPQLLRCHGGVQHNLDLPSHLDCSCSNGTGAGALTCLLPPMVSHKLHVLVNAVVVRFFADMANFSKGVEATRGHHLLWGPDTLSSCCCRTLWSYYCNCSKFKYDGLDGVAEILMSYRYRTSECVVMLLLLWQMQVRQSALGC